jgi:hypothetical protein
MERYGLVQLRKGAGGTVVPRVHYRDIDITLDVHVAPQAAE